MELQFHVSTPPVVEFAVLLAGPKYGGNVGAVARLASNFGVSRLVLYGCGDLDEGDWDDAFSRAMHGREVLRRARVVGTLDEALAGVDFLVGTTGISTMSEKKPLRQALTPAALARRLAPVRGVVGLLFGREDYGLYNEELARCDLLATIGASPAYPVLNLSHAVAILLHELTKRQWKTREARPLDGTEKEHLMRRFSELLDTIDYPRHKRAKAEITFRRLMGRAAPSRWEYQTLMGILGDSMRLRAGSPAKPISSPAVSRAKRNVSPARLPSKGRAQGR